MLALFTASCPSPLCRVAFKSLKNARVQIYSSNMGTSCLGTVCGGILSEADHGKGMLISDALHAGFRFMSGSIIAAYMPDYNQQLFPEQTTVFAAESSIVGVCGFLASTYVGVLTERLFTRLPEVSLYTTSFGSIVAAGFMTLAVFARFVRNDPNGGYAPHVTMPNVIHLTCLTSVQGAWLCVETWS